MTLVVQCAKVVMAKNSRLLFHFFRLTDSCFFFENIVSESSAKVVRVISCEAHSGYNGFTACFEGLCIVV